MTRIDRKILFTSLAFVAVIMKGKDAKSAEATEQIRQLSGLIEIYCAENVINASSPVSDETGALVIDDIIARHVRELRENEETRLPDDRQTLIKIHDRLKHRKTRRMQRKFYGSASEAKLTDTVLKLLDEEIDDDGKASLA